MKKSSVCWSLFSTCHKTNEILNFFISFNWEVVNFPYQLNLPSYLKLICFDLDWYFDTQYGLSISHCYLSDWTLKKWALSSFAFLSRDLAISMTAQRGNATSIMGTLGPLRKLEDFFDVISPRDEKS